MYKIFSLCGITFLTATLLAGCVDTHNQTYQAIQNLQSHITNESNNDNETNSVSQPSANSDSAVMASLSKNNPQLTALGHALNQINHDRPLNNAAKKTANQKVLKILDQLVAQYNQPGGRINYVIAIFMTHKIYTQTWQELKANVDPMTFAIIEVNYYYPFAIQSNPDQNSVNANIFGALTDHSKDSKVTFDDQTAKAALKQNFFIKHHIKLDANNMGEPNTSQSQSSQSH